VKFSLFGAVMMAELMRREIAGERIPHAASLNRAIKAIK